MQPPKIARPLTGQLLNVTRNKQQVKSKSQQDQHHDAPEHHFFSRRCFCNGAYSRDRWKVFWGVYLNNLQTHACTSQTTQYIKEATVDYLDVRWLVVIGSLCCALGSNKDLLSCVNHIQPPTDWFVLLCLLHRPWSTQGSHL